MAAMMATKAAPRPPDLRPDAAPVSGVEEPDGEAGDELADDAEVVLEPLEPLDPLEELEPLEVDEPSLPVGAAPLVGTFEGIELPDEVPLPEVGLPEVVPVGEEELVPVVSLLEDDPLEVPLGLLTEVVLEDEEEDVGVLTSAQLRSKRGLPDSELPMRPKLGLGVAGWAS